jgi:NDP-4-keto-2,6-dideoxyhexose 3-C-methyltransferase
VPTYTERTTCRICEGQLVCVLHLGNQYLPRFVPVGFMQDREPELPKAPLRLARCQSCGLLQLHDMIDADLVYREYWYRSSVNASMRKALLDLRKEGTKWHLSGKWLDIGANDGTLLGFVPKTFKRMACEPALNLAEELQLVADDVMSDYFRFDERYTNCQVITSAAMFYDLNDPGRFVDDIVRCLAPDGVWINQLNDASTMIEANSWDGVCHEHNVYYDMVNLESLYLKHGLKIVQVSSNDVNGGSVRVTAKHAESPMRGEAPQDRSLLPSETQVMRFAQRAMRWKKRMTELVEALPRPIYGYGASTKGGVLLQYLDSPGLFAGVADRNPLKYGKMQAGIWSPIVSEEEMRSKNPGTLFVLPWAFRDEFIERESHLRSEGTIMLFPLPTIEAVL